MTTEAIEKRPDLLKEVAALKSQMTAFQEELQTILRRTEGLQVILPELHDKASGRIDAQKLADYMGVPLKKLAEALKLNYKAVHRNPAAETFQTRLRPVKRCLDILREFFNKQETVRIWLNTPHPDLDGNTALEMILAGDSDAVLRILENAVSGVPV